MVLQLDLLIEYHAEEALAVAAILVLPSAAVVALAAKRVVLRCHTKAVSAVMLAVKMVVIFHHLLTNK